MKNVYFNWELDFPETMLMNKGVDLVIGNPPYVSTKAVTDNDKKIFKKSYGFADDLYSHFFFKSFDILKKEGILSFITSDTFLTIGTKANVRNLLQKKKIIEIIKMADVFDAMVSTAITNVKNTDDDSDYNLIFKDAVSDFNKPQVFNININTYRNAVNFVFFPPTKFNNQFYKKYNKTISQLHKEWWSKINTSKNIAKNVDELENYRKNLKQGDVALLGTITDGGVGLQTSNNGKFVGVKENTKQAKSIIKSRPKKLLDFVKKQKINLPIENKEEATIFLNEKSEIEIRKLFDELKEKHGRDIFGKGHIFKIISENEIADIDSLTNDEKKNGIDKNKPHFVLYDKGDRDGNRWYLESPFLLNGQKRMLIALKLIQKPSGKDINFISVQDFAGFLH